MKKIGLIVILSLLFIILITPYIYGHLYKSIFYSDLEALQRSQPEIKMVVVSYNVGWLQSQALVSIALPQELFPPGMSNIINATSTIQHGPLIHTDNGWQSAYATMQTVVHLSDEMKKFFLEVNNDCMFINSHLALNGTTMTSHIIITPMSYNNPPDKFIWTGLTGDIISEKNHGQIVQMQNRLSVGKIYLIVENKEVWIEPIEYSLNAVMDVSGLWNSTSSLNFPSLIVKTADGLTFSINNVNNKTSSAVTGGLYNLQLDLAIERILSPSTFISTFTNTKFSYVLNNINAAGYANINKNMLNQSDPRMAALFVLLQSLSSNSSMDIALSSDTNLGAGAITLSLAFTEVPKTVLDLAGDLNSVLTVRAAQTLVNAVLVKFVVSNSVSMGSPMSEADAYQKVKVFIADLIQNNYLKQDDKDYFLSIKKVGQNIILNDQKIDINAVSMHLSQSMEMLMAVPTAAPAPAAASVSGDIGYPDANGMLPSDFPIYTDGKVAANQPIPGFTKKIFPTNNDYQGQPGCYMACFTSDAEGSLYQVGDAAAYAHGQVRVPGNYVKGHCVPLDSKLDVAAICNQKIPSCTGRCRGGDETDWFGLSR